MNPVYIVRQDPDHSSECFAFADYRLAREAAAIVDGWVEEEPIMGADFVEHLRAEYAPYDPPTRLIELALQALGLARRLRALPQRRRKRQSMR